MSKLTKNMDLILQQGPDLIEFYRNNPCIAAYELLGVDLAPIQRILFEAMWFNPYVMAICGRGFGKSTYVHELSLFSNNGLCYLHEEFPEIPKYLKDGEDTVVDYKVDLCTSEGIRSTKKLCLEKGIKGKKVTTNLGLIKRGSNHHPLLTVDNEGNFVYKTLDSFVVGDRVCIQRGQNIFGNNNINVETTYMVGLSVSGNGVGAVPYSIRTSTRETQIAFLKGCFGITESASCHSISRKLLEEIQMMLLNFGIVSILSNGLEMHSLDSTYTLSILSEEVLKFKEYIIDGCVSNKKHNYYFDTITDIEDWQGDCYDFEMDMGDSNVEPNYMTNGFINHNTFLSGTLAALLALLYPGYRVGLISSSFRQSKLIFNEVEKLYTKSPILQEATEKRPIRGSDTCYLKFKSVAGYNGSFIEALPLGADGSKIRGSRFYCLLIDEFAQVPQKIIETVLAPMSVTKLDPMKKVRELERRKALIEAGLATEADFVDDTVNKMIGTSSGFYKFNHMYARMREYWKLIDEGSTSHAVFQIPYTLLPEGFLDEKNIENAKRVMSDHEFRMEYMADMVSDSEGFFKASLLEACTTDSGFFVELSGDPNASYVMGVDPNQGGSAKCGIVIVKISSDFNRVVRVLALEGKTTQDITTAIQQLCDDYNIVRVFMDRGGGGKAVLDLLEEGYGGKTPILDLSVSDNLRKPGKHILEVIAFSTSWIADANYATLALIEDKKIKFPERAMEALSETAEREYDTIDELKKQCLSIIVTSTASGALHFDTPKKSQNKDLYSAFILAGYGVRILELASGAIPSSMLYNKGGLIRGHDGQQPFRNLAYSGGKPDSLNRGLAVPTRRTKLK